MEDFQIIDNCLMVRMPEEVDHHRASYICAVSYTHLTLPTILRV